MRKRWILVFVAVAGLVAVIGWEWPRLDGAIASSATTTSATSNANANTLVLREATGNESSPKKNPLQKIRRQSNSQATVTQTNATGSVTSSAKNVQRHNINQFAPAPASAQVSLLPIDHDHAMDLFADEITRDENGEGDESFRKLLKQFQKLPRTPDRADELRANLDAWATQLSTSQREHFEIVAVECRANICRILMAENGLGAVKNVGVLLPESLQAQAWWRQMGIVELTYGGHLVGQDGYALNTIYIVLPAGS